MENHGIGRKVRLRVTRDASGAVTDVDENLCYVAEGAFKDDRLDGFARKIWNNGHQCLGWWANGELHGFAIQQHNTTG